MTKGEGPSGPPIVRLVSKATGEGEAPSRTRWSAADAPGKLEVTITYVEMRRPPTGPPAVHRAEPVAILRAESPTVSFYRYLYDTVGGPWRWYERRLLGDDELGERIWVDTTEVHVLYVGGVPAGYCELDRSEPEEVEIAYFGLIPEFIGRGLGSYFLDWTVRRAWRPPVGDGPSRVWLHTCTMDHPNALATYQRAGFEVFDRATVVIDDPSHYFDS